MRILFTFVGGHGHRDPLLPVARAADAAGHTVRFGCAAPMVAAITRMGFTAVPLSDGAPEPGHPPSRVPLQPLDPDREDRVLRDRFAGEIARERAVAMRAQIDGWRPDVIVCDEVDFGAMVAAEQRGVPHASVLVIAAGSFVRPEVVAAPLHALRREHGLAPDPDLRMLHRHLVLTSFPPSLRDPAHPLPATAQAFRRDDLLDRATGVPDWAGRFAVHDVPTVYLTLGTVFNAESGDLFERALAGIRDRAVNVVATVGPHVDPRELGPQPANVHVTRFIPQAQVLAHSDVVVCHGGSGSLLGALTHGLPTVLLPLGADQPHNAARCVALGAGIALDAEHVTSAEVGRAVGRALDDPSYRVAAEQVGADVAALPEVGVAVARLEPLGP